MKKQFLSILAAAAIFSFAACGNNNTYSGSYDVKSTVYANLLKADGTFDESIADTSAGYSTITFYNEKGLIDKSCVLTAYDGENGESLDETDCPDGYEILEIGGVKCRVQIKDKYTYTYSKKGYPEKIVLSEMGEDGSYTDTEITVENTTKNGQLTAVSMDGFPDLSNSVIYQNCVITTNAGTITFTDGDLSSVDMTDGSYYHYDNERNTTEIYSVAGGYSVDITYNEEHLMSVFDYKSTAEGSTEQEETVTNYTFTSAGQVDGMELWSADCGTNVLKLYYLDQEGRVVYTSYTDTDATVTYGSTYTEYQ